MKSALLALLLLLPAGCADLVNGGPPSDCHYSPLSRSYDLTVTCSGSTPYQGRVRFEGEPSEPEVLKGKVVSGHLDPFSFSMVVFCSDKGSSPEEVNVRFLLHADEQGHVTVGGTTSATASSETCSFTSPDHQGETVTCLQAATDVDQLDCQATLTWVP